MVLAVSLKRRLRKTELQQRECILILQYTQPWRLYRKRMRVTGISGFTENQELISCFVKRRSGKN